MIQIICLIVVGGFLLSSMIHTFFQSKAPYVGLLYLLGLVVIIIASGTQRSGLSGIDNTIMIIGTFLMLIILSIIMIVANFLRPDVPTFFAISIQTLKHHYPVISSIPFVVFLVYVFSVE